MKSGENFFDKKIQVMCEYRLLVSIFVSLLTFFFYEHGLIINIREVLPHVLTFSTILIAVISLVFSVVLSIRDGNLYKFIKKQFSESIKELYGLLKSSILYCIGVVLVSLIILTTNMQNILLAKMVLCMLGSWLFSMMILTSIGAFMASLSLLNLDEEK